MADEVQPSEHADEGINPEEATPSTGSGQADPEPTKAEKAMLAKMHESTQEAAALRKELEDVKARVADANRPPPAPDPLTDEKFLESVRDDPVVALKFVQEQNLALRQELADVLTEFKRTSDEQRAADAREREGFTQEQIQEERKALGGGFSDDQIVKVLKNKGAKVKRVPGQPTGTVAPAAEKPSDLDEIRKSSIFDRIYGPLKARQEAQIEANKR